MTQNKASGAGKIAFVTETNRRVDREIIGKTTSKLEEKNKPKRGRSFAVSCAGSGDAEAACKSGVKALAFGVVGVAGVGGDGKAGGDGQADIGHFREVCALAAEQVAHGLVAFFKQVNSFRPLFRYPLFVLAAKKEKDSGGGTSLFKHELLYPIASDGVNKGRAFPIREEKRGPKASTETSEETNLLTPSAKNAHAKRNRANEQNQNRRGRGR